MGNVSKSLLFFVLLAIAGLGLWYLSTSTSPIITSNGRAEEVADGVYAVYVDIENTGPAEVIKGIGISSKGDMSFIGIPDGYTPIVPSKSKASFSSDGAHIMYRSEGDDLKEGAFITFNLDFENAGSVSVKAIVAAKGDVVAPSEQEPTNEIEKPDGDSKMDHSMHGSSKDSKAEMDHSMHQMGLPFDLDDPTTAPTISMTAQKLTDGEIKVQLETSNFSFIEPVQDPPTHVIGQGHGHLYLNGLKLQRMYQPTATISDLPSGNHQISVSLNTNDHRVYTVMGKPVRAVQEVQIGN